MVKLKVFLLYSILKVMWLFFQEILRVFWGWSLLLTERVLHIPGCQDPRSCFQSCLFVPETSSVLIPLWCSASRLLWCNVGWSCWEVAPVVPCSEITAIRPGWMWVCRHLLKEIEVQLYYFDFSAYELRNVTLEMLFSFPNITLCFQTSFTNLISSAVQFLHWARLPK